MAWTVLTDLEVLQSWDRGEWLGSTRGTTV